MSEEEDKIALMGREPVCALHDRGSWVRWGLTKRELFAAMIFHGHLALNAGADEVPRVEELCKASVRYADALLAELAKGAE